MNQEKDKNKLASRINGIVQMGISFVFIYFHGKLFYGYNYTNVLYFVMIPEWILTLNILLGIIGVFIGIRTYKGILKIWKGYIWIIAILVLGSSLDTLTT